MALSMATKKQVTKEMAQRYARARKRERGRMLDELCALAGYNRSYAARLLRLRARAPARPAGARRRDRGRIYGPETREPLRRCWAVAGGICGKRLAPFLPELVAALERHQEIELSGEQREKLLAVSAATIDRLLAGERRRIRRQGASVPISCAAGNPGEAAPLPEESAGARRPKVTTAPERFVCAGCGNGGYAVRSSGRPRPGSST